MTVATELALGAQRMEYILCIEGVGWPADLSALSTAWQGTVIVTADLDGGLATALGCSIKGGLIPPDSISETLDPVTLEHSPGGADFTIVSPALWLDDVFTPRQKLIQSGTYYGGALMADLTYGSTTIDIDQDNPGGIVHEFIEGDVVWVGGREAILLGSRAAQGGGYRYTGCTRGYLGTPRGSWAPDSAWHGQHTFAEDTIVYPRCPFWYNRRVILFAHVPGEARGNCARVFTGRMTAPRRIDHGVEWQISATALTFPGKRRKRVVMPLVLSKFESGGMDASTGGGVMASEVVLAVDESSTDPIRSYAIDFLYRYRTTPGGAELAESTASLPQAETITQDFAIGSVSVYLSNTLIKTSDGAYSRLLFGDDRLSAGNGNKYRFHTDKRPLEGSHGITSTVSEAAIGNIVSTLVDCLSDDPDASWFAVNGTVRRNVIDVALILLTSCDSEFFLADAAAAGSTTVVNFTSPGWTADQWIGYALHCVEGTNKGEARVITDNDTASITVGTPFTAATHEGNEYQIRNTIYDVLPIGWGMGVHNADIDVDSFETVRDRYLQGSNTGAFVLGEDADTDYWDLVVESLLRSHGVFAYVARSTGKLTARYLYALTTDATFETMTSVNDGDLTDGSFKEISILPRAPVSRIEIYTRKPGTTNEKAKVPLTITAGDAEITYEMLTPDVLEIVALFNDEASRGALAAMHTARLFSLYSPPYEAPCNLLGQKMLGVQAGSMLSVTTTRSGVKDPDDGSDGLSGAPCRVLSSSIQIEPGGPFAVDCGVQMLRAINSARIAPAANLTNIVTAGDPDYFEVDTDVFVDEASDYTTTDMMLFAVGDRIAHRAKDGSVTGGPYVIESFGTNKASTPTAANSARINTVGAIADAFTAGDYVTFYAWGDDATTNQELHSHYADSTDEELGTGDAPKEYM